MVGTVNRFVLPVTAVRIAPMNKIDTYCFVEIVIVTLTLAATILYIVLSKNPTIENIHSIVQTGLLWVIFSTIYIYITNRDTL